MGSFPDEKKSLEGNHKLLQDKAKGDSMGQSSSTLPRWVSGGSLGKRKGIPLPHMALEE